MFNKNPMGGQPNFNDMMAEFAEIEKEEAMSGVKKYKKNELADFEAELKAMEEAELAGIDFDTGQLAIQEEQYKKELEEQLKKVKTDTTLNKEDFDVINKTITQDLKDASNKDVIEKIKKRREKSKGSMDDLLKGLEDSE